MDFRAVSKFNAGSLPLGGNPAGNKGGRKKGLLTVMKISYFTACSIRL